MLALDIQAAKNLAIAVIVGFVVLSFVFAVVIKNVMMKLVMMLLMIGLALGVWTQRKSLADCATKVKAEVTSGVTTPVSCTFFGTKVDIPAISTP
ncbi:MAG: hypothetical protein WCO88_08110 [Actinomycetota bacterium]|jgi:hypothetical protein